MKKILFSLLCLTIYTFSITFEVRVNNKKNDSEERLSNGKISRGSSDLELVFDGNNEQKVGILFQNVILPPRATITNAYIQFTVDEADNGDTNVIIVGENEDNALVYSTSRFDISTRTETTINVTWSIPAWNTVNASGIDQRTSNITAIVTEIYQRSGWVSGNAMAFMVKAGAGCVDSSCQRTAESYNGSSVDSPLLHIEYTLPLDANLIVDYRMDECYWLGGAGGVIGDVRDSSLNQLHASSHDDAQTFDILPLGITSSCLGGRFDGNVDFIDTVNTPLLNTGNQFSISSWIYLNDTSNQFEMMVSKSTNYVNGFSFYINKNGANNYLMFLIGNNSTRDFVSRPINELEWIHAIATYDGSKIRLYINGIEKTNKGFTDGIVNANTSLVIGRGIGGSYAYNGDLDEVKIWDRALNATDIATIYNNESTGKNFDGTPRVCPTCDANVTAGIWELIGIPANLNTVTTTDVATIFDELPIASYDQPSNADGWVIYQREYNTSTNASGYSILPYTGTNLKFGQGYWIISKVDQTWNTNTLLSTDYNSTHPACVTKTCVEIDLTSVNKNFAAPDNDPNDGSGKNRNNMLGFVGKSPVDWADCRILVDGVAYTPSGAEVAGYAEKQVWQYNPSVNGSNANGYTTCDDVTPGGCKLEPYKGFWLILHGTSKNKTLKLLIPKE